MGFKVVKAGRARLKAGSKVFKVGMAFGFKIFKAGRALETAATSKASVVAAVAAEARPRWRRDLRPSHKRVRSAPED